MDLQPIGTTAVRTLLDMAAAECPGMVAGIPHARRRALPPPAT
ncbi:hypothetical protein [Streptomyces sp. NPDC051211]